MDTVLDWFKKQGLGWEALINLGLLVVDLGKRLAEKDGVDPAVLDAREAAALKRLGCNMDKLNEELRALIK